LILPKQPEHQQHRQECLCHTILPYLSIAGTRQSECGTDTLVCALARCSV
jgi:hypothetical protein